MMNHSEYLSVGEISKLCNVSKRTLRYYDEIDLLKPEFQDQETGYRYYTKNQVFIVAVIHDLKTLGFSLQKIKELVHNNNVDQLLNIYHNQKNELEDKIIHLKTNLEKILNRIDIFTKVSAVEKNLPSFNAPLFEVKQIAKRNILFTRYKDPFSMESMSIRVKEIQNLAMENKLLIEEPYIIIFHNNYSSPHNTEIEVAAELKGNSKKHNMIRSISQGLYATTVHKGPHEDSYDLFKQLQNWIYSNSFKIIGPTLKVYLKSLAIAKSRTELLSEIQIPIQRK